MKKRAPSNKNNSHEEKIVEGAISPSTASLESRLEWIVRLVQHDSPDPEGTPACRTFLEQMRTYLRGVRVYRARDPHDGLQRTVRGGATVPDELPMRGEDDRKPFDDKLALIRTALRRDLKEFLHPNPMAVPVTAEVTVRYSLNAAGRTDLQRDWITDDVREGLRFRLLEDLAEAKGLLRECAGIGCGKFLVRHYRQEFCSAACRNRTNVRKYYERAKADKRGVIGKPSGAAELPTRKKQGRTKEQTRRAPTK